MKKALARLSLVAGTLLLLVSCGNKNVVINNAFVYLVHDSCYSYGTISGNQWQPVYVGEYSAEVTAIPHSGYVFLHWSDGLTTPNRSDLATPEHDSGPMLYYAYFGVAKDA